MNTYYKSPKNGKVVAYINHLNRTVEVLIENPFELINDAVSVVNTNMYPMACKADARDLVEAVRKFRYAIVKVKTLSKEPVMPSEYHIG